MYDRQHGKQFGLYGMPEKCAPVAVRSHLEQGLTSTTEFRLNHGTDIRSVRARLPPIVAGLHSNSVQFMLSQEALLWFSHARYKKMEMFTTS